MAKFAAKLLQNSKIEVLEDQGIGVIVVISQGGSFHELSPGVNNFSPAIAMPSTTSRKGLAPDSCPNNMAVK